MLCVVVIALLNNLGSLHRSTGASVSISFLSRMLRPSIVAKACGQFILFRNCSFLGANSCSRMLVGSLLTSLFEICRGAFKFRGACNAILSLSEDEAKRGVLTHSRFYHYNHTFTCLPHSTILNPMSSFLPNDAKQKPEASS
jgi:hypothetical protein